MTDYLYDQNSATAARDELAHTIRLLAASNAEKVNILAHSMGNWVFVEAMRQIKMEGGLSVRTRSALWSSPLRISIRCLQIGTARFRQAEAALLRCPLPRRQSLALSKFLSGGESRVGAIKHDDELAKLGAVVIDLTNVKGDDPTDHNKYAQLAEISPQLRQVLENGIGKTQVASDEETRATQEFAHLDRHRSVNILGNSIAIVAGR